MTESSIEELIVKTSYKDDRFFIPFEKVDFVDRDTNSIFINGIEVCLGDNFGKFYDDYARFLNRLQFPPQQQKK